MSFDGYPIELFGGPKDGERWTMLEDLPVVRFAMMADDPKKLFATEDEPLDETPIKVKYLDYVRTRYRRAGHRIYRYDPKSG